MFRKPSEERKNILYTKIYRRLSPLPSVFGNSETKDCIDSFKCLHISNTDFWMFGTHVIFAEIGIMQIIYIYMVFITEGFFEVAIESWPKWDLNQRPFI